MSLSPTYNSVPLHFYNLFVCRSSGATTVSGALLNWIIMVANTTAHPDVYVLALAISEEALGDVHRHLIELFNTQVLRLALEGIPVIVPTSPTPGPHQFSRYAPPTFPQSSPYVTTVTFPEPSEDKNRYDVDLTSPAPCPSCLPCKNHPWNLPYSQDIVRFKIV